MKVTRIVASGALGLCLVIAVAGNVQARCFNKAAEGTNTTVGGAKFQAFEAILQSFSWGTWMSWMTSGTTPGYKIKTRYECTKGTGLGATCIARSRICTK